MVTTSRLAAGLSGLRNRNTRVTNKTLLRVVKGNIEADNILLDDEDDEKNRVLASHGVEEEDAHEHHLQAALFASSQRLSAAQTKVDTTAFIPTPDATGVIKNYDELYPPKRYKDPLTHIRSSESLDEACVGGLSGSFSYFLDERDLEWLTKHNCAARGEGTSANGTALNGAEHSPRTSNRVVPPRSSKSKGKEPDVSSSLVNHRPMPIDEDQFELIMGLFEKWTDEHISPYLHLAPDPEHFPSFDEYVDLLSKPLSSAVFANFEIPSHVPPPDKLTDMARCVYSWWRERRIERKGQRIVPQLHILVIDAQEKEDKTGGSPYTCFRKREVKPMRRTRTNNVTHTDKLARLREELHRGLELSRMVLMREKFKYDGVKNSIAVWQKRELFSDLMKQLNTLAPGSVPPTDEHLLHDRDRKRKRIEQTIPARIVLPNRQPHTLSRDSTDLYSALSLTTDNNVAFEEGQKWPTARTLGIQRDVERTLAKIRKEDAFWEDLLDFPHLSSPAATEKYLKPFPSIDTATIGYRGDTLPHGGRSMRLRTGRGGRLHIDRRFHVSRPRLLQRERATHPLRREEITAMQEHMERWNSRSWRPLEADFKLRRVVQELGEVYLTHASIYNSQSAELMDVDDQEQSGVILDSDRNAHPFDKLSSFRRTSQADGLRPMPGRNISEMAVRGMVDKIQRVEAWRGLTAEQSTPGGALALFTDGGGDQVDHITKGTQQDDPDVWPLGDPSENLIEHAWRIDDRWRYDEDVCLEESDDRFIMDDFQAKYLRTSITLLDSTDHDLLKIDPHLLPAIPAKPSRYLDHQLRQSGLSQFSSIPSRSQIPLRIPSQTLISQNSLTPRPDTTPIKTPSQMNGRLINGIADHQQQQQQQQQQTSPSQNGPIPSSGARLPPDSGPVARISALVRQKQTPNGIVSLQPSTSEMPTSSQTSTSVNGSALYPTTNGVSVMKSNEPIVTPQVPSQQLAGRPITVGNNENSPERNIGVPLGVGNLQLKLPPQQNGTIGASGVPIPGRTTPGFHNHNPSPMYWPPGAVDLTNSFY
ncbi:hypothetical protein Clacol_007589 [Clathrus columnatus]|uniref:Enhancer of polycomb-like protein n=1 Tax=Clathrus columnatus TaxID=1419009 RepID=A0AAV5AFC3_9AGAM|nr:hypothetical protein Clacol_007589 [Clathrus columnatus]